MMRVAAGLVAAMWVATWMHALTGFGGPATDGFFERWLHDAITGAAAATCLWNARRRAGDRLASVALGLGLWSLVVGDVLYSLAPDLAEVPVPSVSDPFWLAIFPAEYVAIVALVRSRVGPTLWATRVDGVAGGLAIASVLAAVSFSTAMRDASGVPLMEALTNLAYPTGDLVLLVAIVSAVGAAGWRTGRLWRTLGAAVACMVTADLIYMTGADGRLGPIADALASTGVLGLACAASLKPCFEVRRSAPPTRGLLVPVLFGSLALGVLVLGEPLDVNPVATGLAGAALVLVLARTAAALRQNTDLLAASHLEAVTDALTGLNNRRRLQNDLDDVVRAETPYALSIFDLNGFKSYNDSYGHGAGDLLLRRLGTALNEAIAGAGTAYRMGGDEFCVLTPAGDGLDDRIARCVDALSTRGDAFTITAAHGTVLIPTERADASSALALADARMYSDKVSGRPATAHQAAGVLLAIMAERAPSLSTHSGSVADLARSVGEELGIAGADLDALHRAAGLHDIGKMAIPESVLDTPGPLSDDDWALIRRHTLIGERVLAAAPALRASARLVRSSHERVDGTGYPDGLHAQDIPLGSRIIAVVDAYDAMTSLRSYADVRTPADAIAELERCSGSQFDPLVVDAFSRTFSAAPV